MSVALAALTGLAAVLLVIALLPLTFEWERRAGVSRSRLQWAFGLVSLDLRGRARTRDGRPTKVDSTAGRTRGGNGMPRLKPLLRALLAPSLRTALAKAARRLLRACHLHAVNVNAVLDLGDPAATGMLWGAVGPAAALVRSGGWGVIDVRPGFADEGLMLAGRARLTIVPAEVIAIGVAFVLSPPVMRVGWALSTGRRP
ncbi:MAG TPA: hypothetical protein VGF45_20155 [Polyangia bacterium]